MNDHDLLATLERSARSVSRLSTATKIMCGLMLFIAAILMLYAFSRAGRNTDDFVGFGLIALAVTAFAFLFWSIAAFHAAFGESLKVVAAVHYNIDQLVRHILRFEVSGETLAFFREALAKLRRDAGEPLDDDAALLLLARQTLGGPKDAGRASYQVALDVCATCRRGQQTGRGELVEVGREVVEMAECDAQHIGPARPDTRMGATPAPARATQTIPPAIRRQVMRRDNGRCVVPGCRHGMWVDVHHLDPRADGGGHDPDNLACMCGAHHRAIHAGKLLVEGRVSSGLVFRHADGTPYGGAVSPHAAQARTTVFQWLTHMGFRESESRRALERASAHVGREATPEGLLRGALAVLTPAAIG